MDRLAVSHHLPVLLRSHSERYVVPEENTLLYSVLFVRHLIASFLILPDTNLLSLTNEPVPRTQPGPSQILKQLLMVTPDLSCRAAILPTG